MDPKNIKMRVVYSSKKAKIQTFATAIGEALKCPVDSVPPAYPCEKERLVVILMNGGEPDDKLALFCRELNAQRAFNVALIVDGDKDCVGVKKVREMLKEAGTNVVEDIHTINGGSGGLFASFNKKISLDERRDIVNWVTKTIEAL